jgi:geranylgeranyl diphosphate synthase type I
LSVIVGILKKYKTAIDATIKQMLEEAPDYINGIINYHFGWVDQNFEPANFERGKMFRPTMNLLVFEAITGDYKGALPVAASIEMIHNFSLMHDDIEDNDTQRRGRPTAWTIWGKPRVINAGDFLYSLAFKSLYQLESREFPAERIFSVLNLILQACLELTEGQELDLRYENIKEVSTDMYLDMVYKKTGALIEASIVSAAKLATSDEELIQNYLGFAQNIGIAFQMQDDILGIWGDTSKTGKSSANDLRRKKKTLPVIYTLNKSSGQRKAALMKLYAKSEPLTDDEIEFVRESLTWAEAYDYARTVADSYRQKAFSALQKIDISNQAQTDLETIARFLVDRSY